MNGRDNAILWTRRLMKIGGVTFGTNSDGCRTERERVRLSRQMSWTVDRLKIEPYDCRSRWIRDREIERSDFRNKYSEARDVTIDRPVWCLLCLGYGREVGVSDNRDEVISSLFDCVFDDYYDFVTKVRGLIVWESSWKDQCSDTL